MKDRELGGADWQFNAWGLGGWHKDEKVLLTHQLHYVSEYLLAEGKRRYIWEKAKSSAGNPDIRFMLWVRQAMT